MAERNRVFFKTVEEAEAAGYTRAGNCPPEEVDVQTGAKPTPAPVAQVADGDDADEDDEPSPAPTPQVASKSSVAPSASTATPTSSTDEPIIGNKNSKIYNMPGCPSYGKVSEKDRVLFKTEAEAQAAGYTRAKNCSPGSEQAPK